MQRTSRKYRTSRYAKCLRELKTLIDLELLAIAADKEDFEISSSLVTFCQDTIKAACIHFGVVEQEREEIEQKGEDENA